MVNFSGYFGISGTVICCIIWNFWPADSKMISKKVSQEVMLSCTNKSVNLLTWKMNGENLFTLKEQKNETNLRKSDIAKRLDINILETKSQLYALVIKNTQKSHEGNYTCDIFTDLGAFEESWELHITEDESFPEMIVVAVCVPCTCFLIIIMVLIILKCLRQHQVCNIRPPSSIRQQPTEDIYENHLEIQRQAQAYQYKPNPQ